MCIGFVKSACKDQNCFNLLVYCDFNKSFLSINIWSGSSSFSCHKQQEKFHTLWRLGLINPVCQKGAREVGLIRCRILVPDRGTNAATEKAWAACRHVSKYKVKRKLQKKKNPPPGKTHPRSSQIYGCVWISTQLFRTLCRHYYHYNTLSLWSQVSGYR